MRSRNNKTHKKKYLRLSLIIPLTILLLIFLTFIFLHKLFLRNKMIINTVNPDKSIKVEVVDRKMFKIAYYNLPGEINIDVAHQLGTWPLKSVWQLGINEKIGGQLLSLTLSKTLKIPVGFWRNGVNSNLSLTDKIWLFIFTGSIKNKESYDIDQDDLNKGLPASILSIFVDQVIAAKDLRIVITNSTGSKETAAYLASVIESLGTKVTTIQNQNKNNTDCLISAKENEVKKLLSYYLKCDQDLADPQGNFDVEIKIGESFKKKY